MKKITHYLFKFFLFCLLLASFEGIAQHELYVGNGGLLFFEQDADFTTSSTLVTHHENGVFAAESGFLWGSNDEYVVGSITVYQNPNDLASTGVVSVGGAIYSPVTITTATGDVVKVTYVGQAPTGTIEAGLGTYALSDNEFWVVNRLSGSSTDFSVSNLVNNTSTYAGELPINTPILLRRDDSSSLWSAYASSPGYGEFSFAAEIPTLGMEDSHMIDFLLYPNPVQAGQDEVYFNLSGTESDLDITIYDVTGKTVSSYSRHNIVSGKNILKLPNLEQGIYLMTFDFNNGNERIAKRLLIN